MCCAIFGGCIQNQDESYLCTVSPCRTPRGIAGDIQRKILIHATDVITEAESYKRQQELRKENQKIIKEKYHGSYDMSAYSST